jgi:hypothetical protein
MEKEKTAFLPFVRLFGKIMADVLFGV